MQLLKDVDNKNFTLKQLKNNEAYWVVTFGVQVVPTEIESFD